MKQKKEGKKLDSLKKEEEKEELPKEEPKKEKEIEVTAVPDESSATEPIREKRRHVRGIWAVTIILIICVIFGGLVWYFVLSDTNTGVSSYVIPGDKKAEEEKKKEEDAKKGLKTYANLSALFSFDYPESWTLQENNNSIILSSDAAYPKAYLSGQMPEMKATDIYIQIHFSNQTLDISREAPTIKPKFSNITIGEVSAKKVTYQNETDFQELIQNFQAGDFYFLILCDTKTANTDKIDAYNKMLSSFKFGKVVIEDENNK